MSLHAKVCYVMKTNIALKLDSDLLREAKILAAEDGCCTCDLAPAVGVTEATVSHHLKQLREAGLVEGRREGMNVFYLPLRDNLFALCRIIDPSCC